MNRLVKLAPALLLTALFSPAPVAAQWTSNLSATPWLGWYEPTSNLLRISDTRAGENADYVRMTAGPVVGFSAELDLSIPVVDVRSTVLRTIGADLARVYTLPLDPGCVAVTPDCPLREGVESLGGGSVMIAAFDLVLRVGAIGRIAPYVLLGGGIRWYDFPQDKLDGQFAIDLAEDADAPSLHLGLGTRLDAGPVTLVIEGGLHTGVFDSPPRTSLGTGTPRFEDYDYAQFDFIGSLGLSLELF